MSKKGWEHPKKLKKLEKFKAGLPILCKRHGEHVRWRMHSDNNVQCLLCASHHQRERKKKNPLKTLLRDAKTHAKNKNWILSITLEDLEKIYRNQDGMCNLSGHIFCNENLPSLDRIDPSRRYEVDNIQLIEIRINKMKSDMYEKEFIEKCKKIVAYSEAREKKVVTQKIEGVNDVY